MEIEKLLYTAVNKEASDIFLVPGMPLSYRVGGKIVNYNENKIFPPQMDLYIEELYRLAGECGMSRVREKGDDDFSMSVAGMSRFRVNVFRQRNSLAAVIRVVPFGLPDFDAFNIPENVMRIGDRTRGLVLVSGPAGSGKTTTLASIINEINKRRSVHVITLEDPIEYIHRHNKSIVTQREIVTDTESFAVGLRAALRQAPDVILVGEMRDKETIQVALTAAETGHLVLSTLHTAGAANTIGRIVDSFPSGMQCQIRLQLSMVMEAVVSQQLVPGTDGREYPAFEILFFDDGIRSLVREGKLQEIKNMILSSQAQGMSSMENSLLKLVAEKKITMEEAVFCSNNRESMEKRIKRLELAGKL